MPYPTSTPYRWATDAGARATPTAPRQATGAQPGETAPALIANDLWGVHSDWIVYLSEVAPADGEFAAETYGIVDFSGPTTIGALTFSGSDVRLSCLSGNIEFLPLTGLVTTASAVLSTAPTDDIRFGYGATPVVVDHTAPAALGGALQEVSGTTGTLTTSGDYAQINNGAATFRRTIWGGNDTTDVPAAGERVKLRQIYTLTENNGTGTATFDVYLKTFNPSTGAVATVFSSTAQNMSSYGRDNFADGGGDVDIDSALVYFIEIVITSPSAGNNGRLYGIGWTFEHYSAATGY